MCSMREKRYTPAGNKIKNSKGAVRGIRRCWYEGFPSLGSFVSGFPLLICEPPAMEMLIMEIIDEGSFVPSIFHYVM